MDFVAEEYRAAPLSDEKARKCCLKVSCCTLGRRKVWVSLPKSPLHPYVILPYTHGQQKWTEVSPERVVPHSRATKMRDSVAQACRAALSGDENVRKCCLSVPRYTLGRRRSAELSLKRAALHPRATKRRGIVAQACRAAPSGDGKCGFRCRGVPFILTSFCLAPLGNKNGLKCRLKVSYCTLGRRKCAELLPESVVLHPRATKMLGSVA